MNRTNYWLVAAAAAIAANSTHAQSKLDICQAHLKAATDAIRNEELGAAIAKFKAASCVVRPTQEEISKASIEGLMFLLYYQSVKRERELASAAGKVTAPFEGKPGSSGSKADSPISTAANPGGVKPPTIGSAAHTGPELKNPGKVLGTVKP